MEPEEDLDLVEYGEFLEDQFRSLSEIAHMYGRFSEQRGPKYSGRLEENWKRYLEAADTVHRVYHELKDRGKL